MSTERDASGTATGNRPPAVLPWRWHEPRVASRAQPPESAAPPVPRARPTPTATHHHPPSHMPFELLKENSNITGLLPRRRQNRSSGPGRNGTGSLAKTEFPTRQFRNSTGSHDTKGLVKQGLFPTVIKHHGETSAALLEARKPSEARTLPALNDLLHEEVLVLENKHRGSPAITARPTQEVGIPGARSDAGYGQLPPVRPASTTVQE